MLTITTALALVTVVGAVFYPLGLFLIIVAVGLVKGAESATDILHAWLQRHHRFDLILVSLTCQGLAAFLAFLIVFAAGGNLLEALLLQIAFAIFLLLANDARLVIRISRRPIGVWLRFFKPLRVLQASAAPGLVATLRGTLRKHRAILFHSWWLGSASFCAALTHNIPRYVIEARMGLDYLGYFTALYYVIHAGNMVVGSAIQVILGPMSRLVVAGRQRQLLSLIVAFTSFILFGGVVGWVVFYRYGALILASIYGKPYAAFIVLFLILLAGGVLRYLNLFLSQVIVAWREFRLHFVLSLAAVGLMLAVALALIETSDFRSIGYAVVIAYALSLTSSAIAVTYLFLRDMRPGLSRAVP
jgi:O-antigen/teichoic acid export membrane protein